MEIVFHFTFGTVKVFFDRVVGVFLGVMHDLSLEMACFGGTLGGNALCRAMAR